MFLQGVRKNDKTSDSIRFGSDVFFVFLTRNACGALRYYVGNAVYRTKRVDENRDYRTKRVDKNRSTAR